MAVIAHIRHAETKYDFLLAKAYDRFDARAIVKDSVDQILMKWREIDGKSQFPGIAGAY